MDVRPNRICRRLSPRRFAELVQLLQEVAVWDDVNCGLRGVVEGFPWHLWAGTRDRRAVSRGVGWWLL